MNYDEVDIGSDHADPYQPNTEPKKMDVLFYDGINRMKRNLNLTIIFHLIKTLMFIILIPIDYTIVDGAHDSRVLGAMILALVASAAQFFSSLLYRCIPMRRIQMLINLAGQMGHATEEKVPQQFSKLQDCVSTTMYNQQNLTAANSEGLTDDLKQMYTRVMSTYLRQTIVKCHPCLNFIDSIAQFLGFVSFVYAIIAMIVGPINTPQLAVLIVFVVLQGFSKILVIIVLAIIALLPVLCILFCLCICCCPSGQGESAKLPDPQKATEKMITDADGTCSICYQNFIVGDDVVRLRCSPKHMFHPLCISGWTKLKATCPICRASINQRQPNQEAA